MNDFGDWTAEEWSKLSDMDRAWALAMSQQEITPEPQPPLAVGAVYRVAENDFRIWDGSTLLTVQARRPGS